MRKKTRWPVPNAHGVYSEACVMPHQCIEKKLKNGFARVQIMQTGQDEWIYAKEFVVSVHSNGEELSKMNGVFATACLALHAGMESLSKSMEQQGTR
jgi:hypothetical protein